MRELRTCDFCGDDAVGTFAVLPPQLDPADAEQRRVVLCERCKTTFESLVEPLLDRAGVESADGTRDAATGANSGDADEPLTASDRDSTVEFSEGEVVDADGEDDESTPSTSESTESPRGSNAADGSNAAEDDADGAGEPADAEDEPQTPPAYGKVVRLLRNREFPMERDAVESLAAGAYDLDEREVRAIVDRAIERGEFVEEGGRLRRP